MRRKTGLGLLCFTCLTCLTLTSFVPLSYAGGVPKYGGTLVLACAEAPSNLGTMATSFQRVYVSSMFNSLLRFDLGMNIKPELAESWEISPDAKTYTFHLVSNATFSDGVLLTARDVKYTIEELVYKYHPAGMKVLKFLDHVETPDNFTVVVKMTQPFAPFIYGCTAYYMCIYPMHLYEGTNYLNNTHTTTNPIGTGPFILQEYVPLDHITLVRNENYWRKSLPYLDKIVIKYVTDPMAITLGLLSGEFDASTHPPFASLDELAKAGIAIDDRASSALPKVGYVYFNLRNETIKDHNSALADIRVRQAILYAIDKKEIADKAYFGYLTPLYGCIPPSMRKWYNPNLNHYDQNVDLANALLDQAGYPKGPDGIRFGLTDVQYPIVERITAVEIIREQLRKVGIVLTIQSFDAPACENKVFALHQFDLFLDTLLSGPDPCIGIARYLTTDSITNKSYSNGGAYSNPEVDRLFNEASAETNDTKRAKLFWEIQNITNVDCPGMWWGEVRGYTATNKDLRGLPSDPYCDSAAFDEVWWITGTATPTSTPPPAVFPWTEAIIAIVVILIVAGVGVTYYRRRRK